MEVEILLLGFLLVMLMVPGWLDLLALSKDHFFAYVRFGGPLSNCVVGLLG